MADNLIDFPISVEHRGILLTGRLNFVNTYLVATLTSPLIGQKSIRYGWASAVCKVFAVDNRGQFTEEGINTGKALLREIYEEAQPEYKAKQKEAKIKELERQIEKIKKE